MTRTLDQSVHPPLARRINGRVIVFFAIIVVSVGLLFVAPIYIVVNQAMTHGIHNRGDYASVDLKALGYFTIDPNLGSIRDVPAAYRALDGKRVELEGFMVPMQSAAGGLTDFQFVYDVQRCCFSGPPLVQERVFAHVPKGKTVRHIGSLARVTGVLHVKVEKDDGVIVSVYSMDVEKAEPKG